MVCKNLNWSGMKQVQIGGKKVMNILTVGMVNTPFFLLVNGFGWTQNGITWYRTKNIVESMFSDDCRTRRLCHRRKKGNGGGQQQNTQG